MSWQPKWARRPARGPGNAWAVLDIAVQRGLVDAAVAYNLGNIEMRRGRGRDAIGYYTQAVELDSDLALAYYNRGVQRRQLGDESGAVADIATAIEKGYRGIDAYAALLRGRAGVLGDPVEALEEATIARQLVASGDPDMAMMLVELETSLRRTGAAGGGVAERLALVVALENEMELRRRLGDIPAAAAIATELATLCGDLARLDPTKWEPGLEPLRVFVVDQLPQRLIAMVQLHALAGRSDVALAVAAEAIDRCGGLKSRHPQLPALYGAVQSAVYITIKKRAVR